MSVWNVLQTGRSGMGVAKVGIATSGHNIANANTEGFSRQRVHAEAINTNTPKGYGHKTGEGASVSSIERINDQYLEKQIQSTNRQLGYFEEKDFCLKQVENIFNELNDDGLNRLVGRFFNEFRKLSDEPENPSLRQSVLEATKAVTNDFRRLRHELIETQKHLDSRIESTVLEINGLTSEVVALNREIQQFEATKSFPNDLLDKRDMVLKKLHAAAEMHTFSNRQGHVNIELRGIGPLVSGVLSETLSVDRMTKDGELKEDRFEILSTGAVGGPITARLRGGKLGALVEVRDQVVGGLVDKLDYMAFALQKGVNELHAQGYGLDGSTGNPFFKPLGQWQQAAEGLEVSQEILKDPRKLAVAFEPNAPGDNRIALAIAKLQKDRFLDNGEATFDEWYNGMVSGIGVASNRNRFSLNQHHEVQNQLAKVRDQISGVSIDEETTKLMEYQHAFDASARVIQIADDMLRTVLALKRD